MKRILGIILCTVLLIGGISIYNVNADDVIPEGYTPIYSVEGLYAIDNNPSGNYILINDIDLSGTNGGSLDSGSGWVPLKEFSGVLDGNGHVIKGMAIHGKTDQTAVGFFSKLNHGTVKRLGFSYVNIDLYFIKGNGNPHFGVICGESESGEITECYVDGDISIGSDIYYSAGGITGYLYAYESKGVHDCYSNLKIKAIGEKTCGGIGGIVGYVANGYPSSPSNCYVAGNIYTDGTTVVEEYADQIGAICGAYDSYSTNCYYPDYSEHKGRGKALTETQMQMSGAYTGFDFNNTWCFDTTTPYQYPELQCFRTVSVPSPTPTPTYEPTPTPTPTFMPTPSPVPDYYIVINPSVATVETGNKIILTVETNIPGLPIAWYSSDKNIAEVNNGTVTGISGGIAVITAKAGNYSASAVVTVVEKEPDVTVKVGKKAKINAKKKVAYVQVSDGSIAAFRVKGKKIIVKGMDTGRTYVTAYNKKGKVINKWLVKVE